MNSSAEKTSCGMEKSLEIGETQNYSIQMVELQIQDLVARTCEQLVVTHVAQTPGNGDYNVEPAAVKDPGEESGCRLLSDDSKSEILIGMEVSDHEPAYQSQAKEPILHCHSFK
ncbi:hypothetical protein F0562_004141 [Nyssa sinensis]|uniref:Uncharacterized protein n=1 Tax=Nyssa sinensis TaxID=561372 RepID=A0A5J5C1D2_9ASTE|nr:hypothetical protein F0562_004141 [Nyssa sinensis]